MQTAIDTKMRRHGRGEAGHALFVALVTLTLMTSLVTGFLVTSANEHTLATNSAASARALYVAEAGLERARKAINGGGTNDVAQLLSANRGGALSFGRNVTFGDGTYDVLVTNNTTALGTVPADPGGANTDTDNIVLVTSTGRVREATRVITAVLGRDPNLTLQFPGAITLPGVEAEVEFAGNALSVCGRDTASSLTTCPASAATDKYAIVTRTAAVSTVTSAISAPQRNNFRGAGPDPSVGGDDTTITSAVVSTFAAAVASAALPANRYTVGCTEQRLTNVTWGSATAPGVFYLNGTCPGSSEFEISGNSTGYGVLVVDSAKLEIEGNFRWEGIIVVTGSQVGLELEGNSLVYGAVVINETVGGGSHSHLEVLELEGSVKIFYSNAPIRAAMNALAPFNLVAWSAP